MIVTCYRYDSGFRNVMDTISLVPPKSSDPLCTDEIKVVLPNGYTLGEDVYGEPKIYDEKGFPCDLCLNNLKGSAIIAVSATRMKGLKLAPDFESPINLQESRLSAGLTQKQLADSAGVNVRLIQKVEGGEAKPGNLTAKNLLAIAKALGVSPYELI